MPDALDQPGVKRSHFRMILNFFSGARAGGPVGHKLASKKKMLTS